MSSFTLVFNKINLVWYAIAYTVIHIIINLILTLGRMIVGLEWMRSLNQAFFSIVKGEKGDPGLMGLNGLLGPEVILIYFVVFSI